MLKPAVLPAGQLVRAGLFRIQLRGAVVHFAQGFQVLKAHQRRDGFPVEEKHHTLPGVNVFQKPLREPAGLGLSPSLALQ